MFMFKAYTVRTYNFLKRYGFEPRNEVECIMLADRLLERPLYPAGKMTAVELYRAGGMGIYQIAKKTGKDVSTVRSWCARHDNGLHEAMCFEV